MTCAGGNRSSSLTAPTMSEHGHCIKCPWSGKSPSPVPNNSRIWPEDFRDGMHALFDNTLMREKIKRKSLQNLTVELFWIPFPTNLNMYHLKKISYHKNEWGAAVFCKIFYSFMIVLKNPSFFIILFTQNITLPFTGTFSHSPNPRSWGWDLVVIGPYPFMYLAVIFHMASDCTRLSLSPLTLIVVIRAVVFYCPRLINI